MILQIRDISISRCEPASALGVLPMKERMIMRPDNKNHQPNMRHGEHDCVRRPFDSREIDRLPQATEDDPPYRPWWIVDGSYSSEGADSQA
jgi:hypothetical protein